MSMYDARAEALKPVEEVRRFRLVHAAGMEVRPPQYLIREYLERDALALAFGDPGTAKSFLAVDWALSIASGRDWQGRRVEKCPVIYIAGEGHNGLARRLHAWCIRHGVELEDVPLFVSSTSAALTDPAVLDDVLIAIDVVSKAHGAPGLVVVDTVARNFGAGDENSTQHMGAFIQACDRLRADHVCTVLLVHHTGHGDKSRARGAMALKGALDAEYRLDRDEAGIIRLEATKMKDASHPEPLAFRLRPVELGLVDGDGEPVTSAVLEVTSYEPPPARGKAGRGKWQTLALEVLRELHVIHRANREESGYDPDGARVSLEVWRQACQERGVPRSKFYAVRDSLEKIGAITVDHGFVW